MITTIRCTSTGALKAYPRHGMISLALMTISESESYNKSIRVLSIMLSCVCVCCMCVNGCARYPHYANILIYGHTYAISHEGVIGLHTLTMPQLLLYSMFPDYKMWHIAQ